MAITEKQRHELFKRAEAVLGEDHAETLMDLLPPVGWADVATKQDIAATNRAIAGLEQSLRQEIALSEARIREDLHKELRQMQLTMLSGMTVLLAIFTGLGQLLA